MPVLIPALNGLLLLALAAAGATGVAAAGAPGDPAPALASAHAAAGIAVLLLSWCAHGYTLAWTEGTAAATREIHHRMGAAVPGPGDHPGASRIAGTLAALLALTGAALSDGRAAGVAGPTALHLGLAAAGTALSVWLLPVALRAARSAADGMRDVERELARQPEFSVATPPPPC